MPDGWVEPGRDMPEGLPMIAKPLIAVLALALAGCTQTAGAPPASPPGSAAPGVTPATFRLPDGAGCAGEIARFRAVLDNDVAVGHLGRPVHARATADIDKAAASCAAGQDGVARTVLAGVRSRYGYP